MSPRNLSVLCIDDEPDHAELLRLALSGIPETDVKFANETDAGSAIQAVHERSFDAVFVDYLLGGFSGRDVVRRLRADGYWRPIVMLTAQGNEYVAAAAIRDGADDYLIKADLTTGRVAAALARGHARYRERLEQTWLLRRAELFEEVSRELATRASRFATEARTDGLTGLLNLRGLEEAAWREQERCARFDHHFALLVIDVDGLKRINDSLGHTAGSASLQMVGRALAHACRAVDVVGRYGGDEFVVLAPETDLRGGSDLAERIRQAVRSSTVDEDTGKEPWSVTVSIGVAESNGVGWRIALQLADQAAYVAKGLGGDRVHAAGTPVPASATSAEEPSGRTSPKASQKPGS